MGQEKIPTSKVQRASRFLKTGLKVGGNYMSHYAKSAFSDVDKDQLDRKNAMEILNVLRQLKGSGLKIAQMLSIDNGGLIPKSYAEVFAGAQNNAVSLSGPLVMNTFKKYIGKSPYELFDAFNPVSMHAASIGQVHVARKNGQQLAVKIQYPGVAESIHSDINMVKPVILRVMGLSPEVVANYVEEIEERLVEETNYIQELENAVFSKENTAVLKDIAIPKYYREYSSSKILVMDWLEGIMLQDFIKNEPDQEKRNRIGQLLLDFVHFQIHELKRFHADIHPGNFMITPDMKLGVLDFGCMKVLPEEFYHPYFALGLPEVINDKEMLKRQLKKIDLVRDKDTPEEEALFIETTLKAASLISKPVLEGTFDFGNDAFYEELLGMGDSVFENKAFRKPNAIRGSKHGIYLHRAFYGLYGILHQLKAKVNVDQTFLGRLKL